MAKTPRSARNGRLTRWEIVLLSIGLVALGVWLGSIAWTRLVQRYESRVFDHELQHPANKPSPVVPGTGRTCGESQPRGACAAVPVPRNSLIGRLSIPRLGLEAMVREGDTAGTLSVALGHIPGTAMPGQNGNVGVAGHRDTLFRGLGAIRRDDLILFQTRQGTYRYQVAATQVVKPTDVAVLRDGKFPELTLVTCYPFYYVGSAPERFIVKARLAADEAGISSARPGARLVKARSWHHLTGHSGTTVATKTN